MTIRVCVLGAGSSGLTAIKQCLDEGFEVVCFEKTKAIGGLWRYKEGQTEEDASVMKSTISNTSKEMSAYSDFPPPDDFPNYMHNSKMIQYFQLYAESFKLLNHIRFNHEVIKVEPDTDHEQTGNWKVKVFNKQNDKALIDVFNAVMIFSGHYLKPISPSYQHEDLFKGRVMHSHSYKTFKGFEDKAVVVVGSGNSAVEIAAELATIAKQVYLSTRKGAWILPRLGGSGLPFDGQMITRLKFSVLSALPSALRNEYIERIANQRIDHEIYGLKPTHRASEQHPTISDTLPTCLISGRVILKPDIKHFTTKGVVFAHDDKEIECDTVIVCTGYEINFPFLDHEIIPVQQNDTDLFKNVFNPNLTHPETLAIIGLVQVIGSVFPVAEMQSRWFAQIMAGKCQLPSQGKMRKIIESDKFAIAKQFYGGPRHKNETFFISYLDYLASLMGVKPNLLKLSFKDPWLWWALLTGPCVSYQYRLKGPHNWKDARKVILSVDRRIRSPFLKRA